MGMHGHVKRLHTAPSRLLWRDTSRCLHLGNVFRTVIAGLRESNADTCVVGTHGRSSRRASAILPGYAHDIYRVVWILNAIQQHADSSPPRRATVSTFRIKVPGDVLAQLAVGRPACGPGYHSQFEAVQVEKEYRELVFLISFCSSERET